MLPILEADHEIVRLCKQFINALLIDSEVADQYSVFPPLEVADYYSLQMASEPNPITGRYEMLVLRRDQNGQTPSLSHYRNGAHPALEMVLSAIPCTRPLRGPYAHRLIPDAEASSFQPFREALVHMNDEGDPVFHQHDNLYWRMAWLLGQVLKTRDTANPKTCGLPPHRLFEVSPYQTEFAVLLSEQNYTLTFQFPNTLMP